MFYAFAVVLCLAVLFIVIAVSSVVCSLGLRAGQKFLTLLAPRARARALFLIRALPLFLAVLITLGFTLPAFLRYEPRSSNEMLGPRLLGLAALGGLVIACIVVRAVRVLRATKRAQKQWRALSTQLRLQDVPVPVYCTRGDSPLLAVTGMIRPQIFVAQSVVERLSSGELFASIAHELAHVHALDNLKQLFLKTTAPPAWLRLFPTSDGLWINASEMAADEGAIATGASALDLSSALVKVGGLSRHVSSGRMLAASHLLPVAAQSCIAMRVNHLRELLDHEPPSRTNTALSKERWQRFALLLLILGYAATVNAVLPWMHEVLELLVR